MPPLGVGVSSALRVHSLGASSSPCQVSSSVAIGADYRAGGMAVLQGLLKFQDLCPCHWDQSGGGWGGNFLDPEKKGDLSEKNLKNSQT